MGAIYIPSKVEELSTSLTGLLKGSSGSVVAASGTDYLPGTVPVTITRASGSSAHALVELVSNQAGYPILRLWSDRNGSLSPWSFFTDSGAFYTQAYVVISGAYTGTGDSLALVLPTSDPGMLVIYSDVGGPAVQVRGSGAGGSYLYSGLNAAGSYTWGVDEAGKILWGSSAAVASLDTNLYRVEADTLGTDDAWVAGGKQSVQVVRLLAAGINSTTELGTVTLPGGGCGVVRMCVSVGGTGYSSAKLFEIPVQFGTDSTWYEVAPQKSIAPYGGYGNTDVPDFRIDVSFPSATAKFRVRNLSPTLPATATAAITIEGPYQRWVDTSTTATGVATPAVLPSQTVPLAQIADGQTATMRRPSLYWNTTKGLPAVVDPSGTTAYIPTGPSGSAGSVQIAGSGLLASDATLSFDTTTKTLTCGSNLVLDQRRVYTLTRALTANADSTVEVGTITLGTSGAGAVEVSLDVWGGGYAFSAWYTVPVAFGGDGAWYRVMPDGSTGPYGGAGGPMADLEINSSSTTVQLRVRNRTAASATAYVRLLVDNATPMVSLTSAAATGVPALTAWFNQTVPKPLPVMADALAIGCRGPGLFLGSDHLDGSSLPHLCRLNSNGTVTAITTGLSGDGSALTNLNATQLASGTVADARLSSNVFFVDGTRAGSSAATTGNAFALGSTTLTSGTLIKGTVPSSGFTGSILKVVDNAGSPVTKFEVSSAGVITTGTIAESQVTNLVSDLALKAPLASPTFTGTPAAPTAAGGTNTTQLATTAFVASAISASGGGSVTSVSVTSANGFAGTVATATVTPAITISTTVTGLLKGNGTAISAASAGTDYLTPSGDGSALTNLNATALASGTVADARLSSNIFYVDGTRAGSSAATTGNAFSLGSTTLTSGVLLKGTVPSSGFTGSILKVADNAGSPATKFEVSSAGAITTGTIAGASVTGTVAAAQMPAFTGNVTTSAGSTVTTIAAGVVTNAMLAGSITASNLVGSDIATVGTVTTGTWSATAIAATKGGTSFTSYALGDIIYSSATNVLSKLAGNTTSTKQFLNQTGTGTVSAAPAWAALVAGDIPNIAESQVTSLVSDLALKAPLASPTFTGTPAAPTPSTADNTTKIATTAYVQAQSYLTTTGNGSGLTNLNATALASGTVADARLSANVFLVDGTLAGSSAATTGNAFSFGSTTLTSGTLIKGTVPASGFAGSILKFVDNAGSPATKFEVSSAGAITTGTLAGSSVTGTVAAAQMPAFTGNVTTSAGSTATTIASGVVTNAMLAGSIAASKLVGSDIATVGTVTTGTWSATAIAATKGGTGLTAYTLGDIVYSSATNTVAALAGNTTSTKQFLNQTGTGTVSAAPAWAALVAADIPNLDTAKVTTGTWAAARMPALTGDVTTSAGAVATSIGSGVVTNAMLAGSIAASKLVGSDIATVGTVTTGTWSATAIAATKGGTGLTAYTLGDIVYSSATNTVAALAGNTTSTKKYLNQTGTGSVSAAPSWNAIAAADVPVFVASGASHAVGVVPDPGSSAGTTKFLREDATWVVPGGSGTVTGTGTSGSLAKWTSTTAIGNATASDVPNIAESQVTNLVSDLALKAPLASPQFSGNSGFGAAGVSGTTLYGFNGTDLASGALGYAIRTDYTTTATNLGVNQYFAASFTANILNNQVGTSNGLIYALSGSSTYTGSSLNGNQVRGLSFTAQNNATGGAWDVHGVYSLGLASNSGGTQHTLAGVFTLTNNTGSGTVAAAAGVWIDRPVNSGSGTYTNLYGLYIENQTPAAGTNPSTVYSIYAAGTTNQAYFLGSVRVGSSGVAINGSTSGTTTLQTAATASGTLSLPAATDTLVARATTDTLSAKTLTTVATFTSPLITVGITSQTAAHWVLRGQSSTTAGQNMATVDAYWESNTDATRKGGIKLSACDSTGTDREGIRLGSNGSAALLGFYGATAAAKPTVTGSRGGNAALASLLSALNTLGIITDSSSA